MSRSRRFRFGSRMAAVVAILCACHPARALDAGDLAVIWVAADDPDGIAFVVLRDIPAGAAIRFTDAGWTTSGTFRAFEGGVQYTAATALPAGTVIGGTSPFITDGWSINSAGLGSTGVQFSTSGDQVLVFVGDAAAPQFIHAVTFDSSGFSEATSSNSTALPTGLVVGLTAVNLGETDGGYYNGPTQGAPEDLLAAIGNSSNWVTSDDRLTPPDWTFIVSGGAPAVTGVDVGTSGLPIGSLATVTVTLSGRPLPGQPATVELTSGAFAAPASLVISDVTSIGVLDVPVVNEGLWTVTATPTSGALGTATSASFTVGAPVFPPTAFAGADRNVPLVGSVVVVPLFDASADDFDGLTGLSYAWTPETHSGLASWQNRTGAVTATSDPGNAVVTFDALGVYTLTLTVTDADDQTATDTITVRVVEPVPDEQDEYAPPPDYYADATGTGSTLQVQLSQILASGHIQQSYGDFKYTAARYDADPDIPGNILLVYDRASVPAPWDLGATWNREHVWPQSLQPGEASDSTTGNLADPYVLRPATPSTNGARGNKPYGTFDAVGVYHQEGSYFFPGDADKGDVARGLFYSATRYMATLSLVNGIPTGNTMGDLASLVRWNFTDPPDTFERRRTHLIYEDQHNRNPFVDHPEFVWSVFGDGANSSTLHVSAEAPPDGASTLDLALPPVIVGGPLPPWTPVVLHKSGQDPTYYAVTTSGDGVSGATGRYNAFDFGPQQRTFSVGLAAATSAPGVATGTVVINNLDITSEAPGQGADDGNDIIALSLTILDHAEGSLAPAANVDATTIAFPAVEPTAGVQSATFDVYNLASTSGWTADLDIVAVQAAGDVDVLACDAAPFAGLAPGAGLVFSVTFDPAGLAPGTYAAEYTIAVADEALPGGTAGNPLAVTLKGVVAASTLPFDADHDGDVDGQDWASFVDCLTGPGGGLSVAACDRHDADADTDVDLHDAAGFQRAFTGMLR